MTELIIKDLKSSGNFYNAPQAYFYFSENPVPQLLPIELKAFPLSAFLLERYGLNAAEKRECEHVIFGMANEAFQRGESIGVHRLAHFVRETLTLYVSRFDGHAYRLDGEKIDVVTNGTDGVFFWDEPDWESYEPERNLHQSGLLDQLIVNSPNFAHANGLSVEDQRWVLKTWLLSQFFDTLHPTKPLLLNIGPKGGAKSFSLKKWLKIIFGRQAEPTSLRRKKPDDFVAAVCSLPFVVFDNVDEHVTWLPDYLAQLATGIAFKMRKFYTTNEMVEYKPQCWLAMTSRTPKFIEGRDDVLDRTIILQTDRLSKFISEERLLGDLLANRNRVWTELLFELNRIVAFLRKNGLYEGYVPFRMADFATFALTVARLQGMEDWAVRILDCIESKQSEMLLAGDPIYVCLEKWLETPGNSGRKVSSGDLHEELESIAPLVGVGWPYPNVHSLGQRLFHIASNLSQRFRVKSEKDSANQRHYRFWPKAESLNHSESDLEAIQAPK